MVFKIYHKVVILESFHSSYTTIYFRLSASMSDSVGIVANQLCLMSFSLHMVLYEIVPYQGVERWNADENEYNSHENNTHQRLYLEPSFCNACNKWVGGLSLVRLIYHLPLSALNVLWKLCAYASQSGVALPFFDAIWPLQLSWHFQQPSALVSIPILYGPIETKTNHDSL